MGDLIDRDAAIAFVDCGYLRPPTELAWSDKDVVDMLKRLPSAQPEIDKAIRDAYKHGKSKGIKRGMAMARRKHEE